MVIMNFKFWGKKESTELTNLKNLIEDMKIKQSKTVGNITVPNTIYRYRQIISDLIPAIQAAENVMFPTRRYLLDIFKTVELDAKVTGKIQNRINTTVIQDFVIKKNGEKQDDLVEFFEGKWFRDITYYILSTKFYGFTGIELESVIDNRPTFKLIDRYNIQPDRKEILKAYTDTVGVPISEFQYVIYIGEDKDLGIYTKIAQYQLYKKELLRLSIEYAERYGTPFRIAKVSTSVDRQTVWDMLAHVGAHGFGIFDENTSIEEIANNAGVGETIFERLIAWCDEQIAYLITGEDINESSNYSEANVNEKTADKTSFLDNLYVQDVVNQQILPFLINLGFTELIDCKFEFHFDQTLGAIDQIAIDAQLMQHFDLDIDYLEEKYNTKIVGRKEAQPSNPFMSAGNLPSNKLNNDYKIKKKW